MDPVPYLLPPPAPEPPLRREPGVRAASEWLAGPVEAPRAIVVGIPFSGGSISRARTDLAPAEVRRALARFSTWSAEARVSLEGIACLDAGDVEPAAEVEETQKRTQEVSAALLEQWPVPLAALGGDNSVTVGAARGARCDGLLTLDAHHDCRDPSLGASNGSVVRQLMEEGVDLVAQIGIHGFANAEAHARWAHDHGVVWWGPGAVRERGIDAAVGHALDHLRPAARVWVDVDFDVLDRAFAPGAPAAMPGGLWPSDLVRAAFLLGRDERVAGIDLVEVDPTADVAETTVRAAAAVLLSFIAGVAVR